MSLPYSARMIRTFQGIKPTVPKSCFIEETAVVIGDVVMGEHCSVWFNAVIRGDVNYIRLGERTNVQDLCAPCDSRYPSVDHRQRHDRTMWCCTATIHDRVLVGMGAISWMAP